MFYFTCDRFFIAQNVPKAKKTPSGPATSCDERGMHPAGRVRVDRRFITGRRTRRVDVITAARCTTQRQAYVSQHASAILIDRLSRFWKVTPGSAASSKVATRDAIRHFKVKSVKRSI